MLAFVLLSFVCVAAAVEPCCFPSQMEGYVTSHSVVERRGRPRGGSASFAEFAIDYKAKKIAASGVAFGGRRLRNFTVVADFSAKKLYLADKKRQRCHVVALKHEMHDSCAPLANSTYAYNFTFGAGDGALHMNAFTLKVHRRRVRVGVTIIVQNGNCVPVIEMVGGHMKRSSFHGDKSFANLELSIKDPKIFTPPSYCKSSAVEKLMYIGNVQRNSIDALRWQHELAKDDDEDEDVTDISQLSDNLQFVMDFFSDGTA